MSSDDSGTRRDFLYVATAAGGTIATGAVVWPMINQMNPSADVAALASIQVDVTASRPGSQITVQFLGKPVFVRRRTEENIAEAEVEVSDLPDPLRAQRQPARRRARHRRQPHLSTRRASGW